MKPLVSIEDKVVILTGGLGLLGRPFSRALVDAGAKVAILDLSPSAIDLPRDRAFVIETDVTKRASLEAALETVQSTFGAPHALINNAAIDSPPSAPMEENGPFESYPEASFDRVMNVNVKGVLLACQVFGGAMARTGRGSIVNIGSIYGMVSPDQRLYQYRRERGESYFKPVAYSVSKSALLNLTRYLATYFAPQKVRVNTLTLAGVENGQDPAFLAAYEQKVPLGRMAQAADYTGALGFLISDASGYMTGSNMVVDGGFTAW